MNEINNDGLKHPPLLHSCSAPYTAVLSINFGFENTPSDHTRIKHQCPMQNHTLVPPPRCSVRLSHHHDSTRRVRFQTHVYRGDASARRTHLQSRQCTGRAVPPPSLKSIQLPPPKAPSAAALQPLLPRSFHAAAPCRIPQPISTKHTASPSFIPPLRRIPPLLLSHGPLRPVVSIVDPFRHLLHLHLLHPHIPKRCVKRFQHPWRVRRVKTKIRTLLFMPGQEISGPCPMASQGKAAHAHGALSVSLLQAAPRARAAPHLLRCGAWLEGGQCEPLEA